MIYNIPKITPKPPTPLPIVPSLTKNDVIPEKIRKNPTKNNQKLANKLKAAISPNKPIPRIKAMIPNIKETILLPLLSSHVPKLWDINQTPKRKMANPASILAVKTPNKGKAITKIPKIIAKIPNKIFLSSAMLKHPLNFNTQAPIKNKQ